jgi:hypothetical protein
MILDIIYGHAFCSYGKLVLFVESGTCGDILAWLYEQIGLLLVRGCPVVWFMQVLLNSTRSLLTWCLTSEPTDSIVAEKICSARREFGMTIVDLYCNWMNKLDVKLWICLILIPTFSSYHL